MNIIAKKRLPDQLAALLLQPINTTLPLEKLSVIYLLLSLADRSHSSNGSKLSLNYQSILFLHNAVLHRWSKASYLLKFRISNAFYFANLNFFR
jgi:hypothetical protein